MQPYNAMFISFRFFYFLPHAKKITLRRGPIIVTNSDPHRGFVIVSYSINYSFK